MIEKLIEKYFFVAELDGEPIHFGNISHFEDKQMKQGISYDFATNTIYYNYDALEKEAKSLNVSLEEYAEVMLCFVLAQANQTSDAWDLAKRILGDNAKENFETIKRY